jgi:hypothetical protein
MKFRAIRQHVFHMSGRKNRSLLRRIRRREVSTCRRDRQREGDE